MRLFRLLTFACCALVSAFCCLPQRAQAAAEEKAEPAPQEAPQKEAPEKEPAAAPKALVQKKSPQPELPILTPRRSLLPAWGLVPEAAKQQAAGKQQAKGQQAKKKPATPSIIRRPNSAYRSPLQGKLNAAAAYRLGSMGQHVQLSPAMRFHLNRSATTLTPHASPKARLSSASHVPGQGAEQYYPSISRQPVQKPFAEIERLPTGLQRYWPLLLEGRENPNTGLIIWSLP